MLLMKQNDYQKLIIQLYKISNYDRSKAIKITVLVINELINYGIDPLIKFKIINDLNLTMEQYEKANNTNSSLPTCEKTIILAMTLEAVMNSYYK